MAPVLEVQHISKTYGKGKKSITGCSDVSFTVDTGSIYSLLGVNGAGKSTILTILSGYQQASSGEVRICGYSMREEPLEAKRRVGMLYEQNPLYDSMSVRDFLTFTLDMRGIRKAWQAGMLEESIAFSELEAVYTRPIKTLSKGFRQRVGLAAAIIHQPPLILLDEPTAGLDPLQLHDFEKKILSLSTHAAVILCTHQLEQAERVCSQHILLHQGRIVAQGTKADFAAALLDDFQLEIGNADPLLLFRVFEKYAGLHKTAFMSAEKKAL